MNYDLQYLSYCFRTVLFQEKVAPGFKATKDHLTIREM